MSESRDSGRPQRYCTSCGSQVRPGNAFFTSCGARLIPSLDKSEQAHPQVPSSPRPQGPSSRAPGPVLRETPGSSRRSSPLNAGEPWRALAWGVRWFRELPLATKVLAAAPLLLVALAILLLLRRLGVALAVLMFVVCLVVFAVRVSRGEPLKGWAIAAAASFVLAFVLSGASLAL